MSTEGEKAWKPSGAREAEAARLAAEKREEDTAQFGQTVEQAKELCRHGLSVEGQIRPLREGE